MKLFEKRREAMECISLQKISPFLFLPAKSVLDFESIYINLNCLSAIIFRKRDLQFILSVWLSGTLC